MRMRWGMAVRRVFFFALSGFVLLGVSCDKLGKIAEVAGNLGLSNEDIVQGLRTALDTASRDAIGLASSKAKGFLVNEAIKIALPEEVNTVVDQMLKLEGSENVTKEVLKRVQPLLRSARDKTVTLFNKAAEEASTTALPVFKQAVKEMTITDGLKILQGGDSAATIYLHDKTHDGLYKGFHPIVDKAVNSVGATAAYEDLAARYNEVMNISAVPEMLQKLGLKNVPTQLTTDVSNYVTEKGLSGLYTLMGEEEKKIRDNPMDYASNIIQKVFGSDEAKKRQ